MRAAVAANRAAGVGVERRPPRPPPPPPTTLDIPSTPNRSGEASAVAGENAAVTATHVAAAARRRHPSPPQFLRKERPSRS